MKEQTIPVEDQLVGVHQAEQNAHESIIEANNLFRGGHYRHAAFFSIVSLEEIGKAFFLLESYEKGKPLSKIDLKDRQSFFNHLQKMHKAREEHVDRVQREFHASFPAIDGKIAIVGFSSHDIDQLWKFRNRLLFVDYNFGRARAPANRSGFKGIEMVI